MTMLNFDIDWPTISGHLILMAIAFVLALPTALNREHSSRSAGLRTFPLVAVSACAFMLIGIDVTADEEARSRIMEGIITGIGFIGGGAILKSDKQVSGTATAAGIWAMGAVGIAIAWQRFEIALVISLLTFLTLFLGSKAKAPLAD